MGVLLGHSEGGLGHSEGGTVTMLAARDGAPAAGLVLAATAAAPIVFGAIGATLLVGGGYFYLSRNTARKRQLWPLWLAIVPVLFGLWGWLIGGLATGAFLVVVSAPLMMLNKSRVRFCNECGRTVTSFWMAPVAEFCPTCGKPLK